MKESLSTVLSMMTEARLDERNNVLDTIELFADKHGYTNGFKVKGVSVDDLKLLIESMRR